MSNNTEKSLYDAVQFKAWIYKYPQGEGILFFMLRAIERSVFYQEKYTAWFDDKRYWLLATDYSAYHLEKIKNDLWRSSLSVLTFHYVEIVI